MLPRIYAVVPLYFFNFRNSEYTVDEEGVELSDEAAAIEYGRREARALAAEAVREGHLVLSNRIEVVDERRADVASIRFDEAFRVEW